MTAELDAARLLLSRLGVTPEQLLADRGESLVASTTRTMPTVSDYIREVSEAVPAGARRTYGSYWRRVERAWGDRRIDEITPLEISVLAERTRGDVIVRSNSRGGRSAAEHLIAALRCLYRHAVADGLIADNRNPSLKVPKPRRLASTRRALSDPQLGEIVEVVGRTGNDPDLDSLLLRLHVETACRRGGALALRPLDLDERQCLIRLREKGETIRWQPVSPTLMRALIEHGTSRGDDPRAALFRYRNGRSITRRRYDYLWQRVGRDLPWVATQQVTTHWLRHTTLTWVERNFGYAVAREFAGHTGRNDAGTTFTYVRAHLDEVAEAVAALTGEPHPLAAHRTGNTAGGRPQSVVDNPRQGDG